jgi:hypothetical protein
MMSNNSSSSGANVRSSGSGPVGGVMSPSAATATTGGSGTPAGQQSVVGVGGSGVASNPLSGTELAKLQSSLELYQNCLSRLKRDVPLYFQKQAESEPHTKKLAKALRNLASSEADTRLQNALFFCVHAYDGIEKEQASLSTASDELLRMIEESKHMVAAPFKELLADSTAGIKANANNPRNRVMCMLCTCFEIFFNGCMCTCRSTLNSYYLFMLPCLRSIASRVSSPS